MRVQPTPDQIDDWFNRGRFEDQDDDDDEPKEGATLPSNTKRRGRRDSAELRQLQQASRDAEKAKPHEIFVDRDLSRMVDESIEILKEDAALFERAGSLVRIRKTGAAKKRDRLQREAGSTVIQEYPVPAMREYLIARTHFFKIETDEDTKEPKQVTASLPGDVVSTLRARAEWPGVRHLEGIVHAPTLRDDGTLLQRPGFDDDSGLLFDPSGDVFPTVPDKPTKSEAMAALERLLDVVCDVPFGTDAHRAAWIGCVLTLIGRNFVAGCTPLFAIDANIRGAGKSLLADVAAIIATGRAAPRMAQPESDAEARKAITSLLMEGERITLIDNVNRPLGSAAIDAVLTSEIWKDRILGASKTVTVPNACVWLATGNNLTFEGDTVRRTLHIRLDSPEENPEDRVGFRYPDLRSHVRAHRGELAAAALTILRGFVCAGAPSSGVKLWGSFEAWSKVVAAACVWVGLPDPQATRVELEEGADPLKAALGAVLKQWPKLFPGGASLREAIDRLYPRLERGEDRRPDEWDGLRNAVETFAPPIPGRSPDPKRLGNALRSYRKRVVSGLYLDCHIDRRGVAQWRVLGLQGVAGSFSLLETPDSAARDRSKQTQHEPADPADGSLLNGSVAPSRAQMNAILEGDRGGRHG